MDCNPEYKCLVKVESLYDHNVIINGEKWHKFENANTPMTADQIIAEIKSFNCDPDQLIIFDYAKGWQHPCS